MNKKLVEEITKEITKVIIKKAKQGTLEEAIKNKEIEIVNSVYGGKSFAEVGREIKRTRERVRQIVDEVWDENGKNLMKKRSNPKLWESLQDIRETFGIEVKTIAEATGYTRPVVSHVLNANPQYIKSSQTKKAVDTGAVYAIALYLITETTKRLDSLEATLEVIKRLDNE